MRKHLILFAVLASLTGGRLAAQQAPFAESFGNTLNLGVGVGYYGYVGQAMPVLHLNYEIGVLPSFTLAPFVTVYSYRKYHYWGNKDYYYRQTVIPFGVKGTYYFDRLLKAPPRWDFYVAGSLGFAYRTTKWESGYGGETHLEHGTSGVYLDGHIGTEFHASPKVGLFLDLSSGLSTFGLAFHL
jgi:hypothetical protein